MTSFIIITVLSALAACYGAVVPPSEENMISRFALEQMYPDFTVEYNEKYENRVAFSKGEARNDQILLLTREIHVPAVPGETQYADLIHRSSSNVRITRVVWIPLTWPLPTLISIKGVGTDVVHISCTSFVGENIHVLFSLYGEIIEN
ncbi:uncharacterized protein LOC111361935 [Spodoptera litura]|uniref:Uncharacterized protein LOC111361935 n=1 Tax=Spodoptera litura TaxID=69820 RepID=A0A9J7J406_SPOLT|nr:uncharacterized protein LOC111361935 [Spodoptera litura]